MRILDYLNGYKSISAFFAAYEIGIFEILFEKEESLNRLAKKLDVDEYMCKLLLYKLKESNWIETRDEYWFLTSSFRDEYKNINNFKHQIKHELNIFNNLMSPNMIINSMKAGYGNRSFDKNGFTVEEQEIYNQAMYGKNVQIIALYLFRILRTIKSINAAEIGRSNGVILMQLEKLGVKFNESAVLDSTFSVSSKYNVIFLFNTIHYWSELYFPKQIEQWEDNLTKDARIFIIDFFYEEGDEFISNVLVDWITHGGVYNITYNEINDMMQFKGYKNTNKTLIKKIHTSIIQYQKEFY